MAHDYWVPPEERFLPAPDAVGRLLPYNEPHLMQLASAPAPHRNQPMLPQPMFDGSMQPHGDDDSSHGFTTEVQRQALCLDVVPVIAPTSCSRVEKDPKEPHGMRRYCANNGCSSILGPGWQYLRCRMCLKPPPPAQPSGDHDSSHELTTEVQQALSVDVAPVVAPTSCGGVEEDPKEPTPTPSAGKHQAFLLGVDGSGGEDVWAVGLIDWQKRREMSYGGRNKNLGGLRAMGDRIHHCDAHIAEAIGLYFALSYARHLPAGGTRGGTIICDRMALLGNLAGKSIVDPVKQRAVDLVKHSLWKLLSVHDYVTFVYKGLYGYGKNWPPDTLATEARKDAWHSNTHLRVPIDLKYGELRFENPLWRPSETNLKEFLELVTVRRGDACRD